MGVGAATVLTVAVFAFAAAATPTAPAPIGQACLTKGACAHAALPQRQRRGDRRRVARTWSRRCRSCARSPGGLCQWMFYARVLERRGFAVLPIDLNGFGSSLPAPGSPVRPHWDRDVAAAAGVL